MSEEPATGSAAASNAGSSAGPGAGAGAPDQSTSEAAALALSRARAAARDKGFRPGVKPRKRRINPDTGQIDKGGRDPQLLEDQLESFVNERGWQVDVAVGAVIGRWPQIVGAEIAQHCHPVEFIDGVLTIRADSTAWATQLRMLSASLMGRLAADVGEGTVTELRIVGPSAPSWSRGFRKAGGGRGPRDTYG